MHSPLELLQDNFYKAIENNNFKDVQLSFTAISEIVLSDPVQLKSILDNVPANNLKKLLSNAHTTQEIQVLQWVIATSKQYESSLLNNFQSVLMHSSTLIKYIGTLSSAGFDVNMKSNEGNRPLNAMAFNGDVRSVELLLEYGANVALKSDSGLDALHCAMYSGKLAIVEQMLQADSVDLTSLDDRGNSLLISAMEKPRNTIDKQAIVEKLILAGVDVNQANSYGATPASLAANFGKVEYLRLLFIGGANYIDDANFTNVENKVMNGRYNGFQYPPEVRTFLIEARKLQEITKLLNANEFRSVTEANLHRIQLILYAAAKNSPQLLIDYYESLYAQSENSLKNYQLAILEQQLLQIRPTEHTKDFFKMMGNHLFTQEREEGKYLSALFFANLSHFEDRELDVLLDKCLKQFVNVKPKSGMTWQLFDKNNAEDKQLYELAHRRIQILKAVYKNPELFMNDSRMQVFVDQLRANKDIASEVYKNPMHILAHLIKYISVEKDPSFKNKIFGVLKDIKDDSDLVLTLKGHKVTASAEAKSHGIIAEQERKQAATGQNEPKFTRRK